VLDERLEIFLRAVVPHDGPAEEGLRRGGLLDVEAEPDEAEREGERAQVGRRSRERELVEVDLHDAAIDPTGRVRGDDLAAREDVGSDPIAVAPFVASNLDEEIERGPEEERSEIEAERGADGEQVLEPVVDAAL